MDRFLHPSIFYLYPIMLQIDIVLMYFFVFNMFNLHHEHQMLGNLGSMTKMEHLDQFNYDLVLFADLTLIFDFVIFLLSFGQLKNFFILCLVFVYFILFDLLQDLSLQRVLDLNFQKLLFLQSNFYFLFLFFSFLIV